MLVSTIPVFPFARPDEFPGWRARLRSVFVFTSASATWFNVAFYMLALRIRNLRERAPGPPRGATCVPFSAYVDAGVSATL